MDLSKYQELTGITVPPSQTAKVTAQISRTQSMLETLLGFTLSPTKQNLYNELGKTQTDGSCPTVAAIDPTLKPADPVIGSYRLFPYNKDDVFLHVDPFTKINKVKLVYVRTGDTPNGVTIREFNVEDSTGSNIVTVNYGRGDWAKYLRQTWLNECICSCDECVLLAVDAEWLWEAEDVDHQDIPEDLLYVWTDMITYYSNPKKGVKSESITSHSYTLSDSVAPELEPINVSVLKKYAGPYGSVSAMPI